MRHWRSTGPNRIGDGLHQAGDGDVEGAGSGGVTGRKRTVVPEFEGASQRDSAKGCCSGSKSLKTNEKEALVQSPESRLVLLATHSSARGHRRDSSHEGSKARIGSCDIPHRVGSQGHQPSVAVANRLLQRGQRLFGVPQSGLCRGQINRRNKFSLGRPLLQSVQPPLPISLCAVAE